MTAPVVVLLPSPLLGPAVWQPVARVLAGRGQPVAVCGLPVTVTGGDDVLASFAAAVPPDREVVLVPHSNAGAYVPELMQRCVAVGAVFVDAILPPSSGRVALAPPRLLDALRDKADRTGLLPPWTRWWDEADVAGLFPDARSRAELERAQPRLPLGYFEGARHVPPGWDARPCAFLAFGDTYADERRDAQQRGWQVLTMPAGHLHQLHDAEGVADAVLSLLARLRSPDEAHGNPA